MGNHLVIARAMAAGALLACIACIACLGGCELIANIPSATERPDGDGGTSDGATDDAGEDAGRACIADEDCQSSAESGVCLLPQGQCVECREARDCTTSAPVCASNTCRACEVDADCGANAACLVDGTCAGEARIRFASPGGSGTACTAAAPCAAPQAVASLSAAQDVVKLAAGTYSLPTSLTFESTAAPRFTVTSEGASLVATGDFNSSVLVTAGAVDVVNVAFAGGWSGASCTGGRLGLHRSTLRGHSVGAYANGCELAIDRMVLTANGMYAAAAFSGGTLLVRNSAVFANGSTTINIAPIYALGANGVIEHSTIAQNLSDADTPAVACDDQTGTPFVIRSSIAIGHAVPVSPSCLVSYSNIDAGYTGAGANNVTLDPMFVAGDLHIGPASPLRGRGDPASALRIDFDGDVRPNPAGTPPDIGADEVP